MEYYIGELRVFPYGKIPRGWAPCDGQSLPIAQNQALFSLLGTTYGGNGVTTFNLPNLQGRTMVHFGKSTYAPQTDFPRGEAKGSETVTLKPGELPQHTHLFKVVNGEGALQLTTAAPAINYLAAQPQVPQIPGEQILSFTPNVSAGNTKLDSGSIEIKGDGQPHENCMPYLTLLVCISLTGIFPSQP